jgi:hypothetical protein
MEQLIFDRNKEDELTGETCDLAVGLWVCCPDTYSERYIYLSESSLRKMLKLITDKKEQSHRETSVITVNLEDQY